MDDLDAADSTARRCPHCEYDLRGHSGQRIRCPECGESIARAELEHIRDESRNQARRGANSAVTAGMFLFLALLALPMTAFTGMPCAVAALTPWLLSVSLAARRLSHIAGWGAKLALHQAFFLLAALFILAAFGAGLAIIGGLAVAGSSWAIAVPWNMVSGAAVGALLALPICAGLLKLAGAFADRALNLLAELGGEDGE